MNVHRGTGASTAVTASVFFVILHKNIILKNKVYTKIHLQLDKSPNEVKNKNECFIIISIPGNVHNCYARAKLYGEG